MSDAVVLAESDDGLIHQARSDRQGIYAFRYLPEGDFRITAFEDRNRDGEADSTEVQGATSVALATGDTILVDVAVLEPDTSAALVTEAEVLDSVTVVVTFDDYLMPDSDPAEWLVDVAATDTTPAAVGVQAPGVARVFHEAGYVEYVQMVADSFARLDSLDATRAAPPQGPPDTSALAPPSDTSALAPPPDTVVVVQPPDAGAVDPPPDTVVVGAPPTDVAAGQVGRVVRVPPTELRPLQGERPGRTRDGRRVLPARRVVVVLAEPLAYEIVHSVSIDGVTNLAGLMEGGGQAEFVRERPPPPEPSALDTAAVADTGAVPDTGAVVDTGAVSDIGAVPDTGAALPRR